MRSGRVRSARLSGKGPSSKLKASRSRSRWLEIPLSSSASPRLPTALPSKARISLLYAPLLVLNSSSAIATPSVCPISVGSLGELLGSVGFVAAGMCTIDVWQAGGSEAGDPLKRSNPSPLRRPLSRSPSVPPCPGRRWSGAPLRSQCRVPDACAGRGFLKDPVGVRDRAWADPRWTWRCRRMAEHVRRSELHQCWTVHDRCQQ